MGQERRKYSRIVFHAPATLILPDRTCAAVLLDLSLKGALVRLPAGATLEDQALCELRVQLDEMPAAITMETRVVHREGDDAGLRCLSIDLDSVTHLRR
ncbi:MAG: PilZ domain-containing protein, partial [Candidatus Accumulibacter sp.]|nr:PilZ domain-containing protein [Accumulibacter sp.]